MLAEKLYPGVSILKDQYVTTYCPDKQKCINSEKAKAILSTFGVEANGFILWSNLEDSTPRAGFRYFGDNNTYWYYNSSSGTKAKSDVLTVCLYE